MIRVLSDIAMSAGGTALIAAFAVPYIIWGDIIIEATLDRLEAWLDARQAPNKSVSVRVEDALKKMSEDYSKNYGQAEE